MKLSRANPEKTFSYYKITKFVTKRLYLAMLQPIGSFGEHIGMGAALLEAIMTWWLEVVLADM